MFCHLLNRFYRCSIHVGMNFGILNELASGDGLLHVINVDEVIMDTICLTLSVVSYMNSINRKGGNQVQIRAEVVLLSDEYDRRRKRTIFCADMVRFSIVPWLASGVRDAESEVIWISGHKKINECSFTDARGAGKDDWRQFRSCSHHEFGCHVMPPLPIFVMHWRRKIEN